MTPWESAREEIALLVEARAFAALAEGARATLFAAAVAIRAKEEPASFTAALAREAGR